MQQFNKAHVAAIAAAITGVLPVFVPSMPGEAVAGVGAIFSWLATFAIRNKSA